MKKLLFRIECCFWYFKFVGDMNLKIAWYLSGVNQEQDDWYEYTPRETVKSELSYWDYEG